MSAPSASEARSAAVRPEILALDAQTGLLPYALAAFAVGIPLLIFAARGADNSGWLAVCLIQSALNWAIFYAVFDWLKKDPARRTNLNQRTLVHLGAGLTWALALTELALVADQAGPAREPLLLLTVAGAVTCFFFTAPHMVSLLVVGPAAATPALWLLQTHPETADTGDLAKGGMALAFALALIVNRLLRRSFDMAAERETLMEDRARALDQAEALAADKSDLLSTLSQEVRTGLSGIVHVLAAAAGPATRVRPTREQLTAALEAARDLVSVLDATVDSEQAEAGKLVVSAEPFAALDLAREVVGVTEPLAAAKALMLTVEGRLDGGAVVADPGRTRQILANLVGNAVKYTFRGGVAVRVSLSAPDRVRFEVADTGPGLTPDELLLAFEPFKRIERTGAGLPGAGLGLSLSRRLARLMGGDVLAESAPGVGSRFWLELPYDPAAVLAPEAPVTAQTGPALRVLAVEPDSLSAAMIRSALDQLGHRMLHAHDGGRALDLLKSCDVDVILVGGRLQPETGSGLTAPETIRAVRALPSPAARARVVAVIGAEIEQASDCLLAGADTVLRKPVTVGAVARALAPTGALSRRAEAA
ncbi:MAG: ATP-binding protein [Pseudomonadota bacterium]|nr:ATP-binding protein [Pseudomonadota bacterium]